MSVGRICTRVTYTATPGESVRQGAKRMAEQGVGSLVVVDEMKRPIGMLTDRDIAVRAVAPGLDPRETTVSEVMSKPVHSVVEDASIESAIRGMAGAAVRRAVVTNAKGKLVGILALDDLLDLLAEEAEAVGALVRSQDRGPAVRA
jgi:CBS domain-containing protein